MPERVLWVHAGTSKTGTTSIQFFLKANEDILLEKESIQVLSSARRPREYHIRHSGLFLFHESKKATLNQVIREIQESAANTFLLTDEALTGSQKLLNAEHLEAIRRETGVTIKAIIYVRRLDDMLKSQFNQKLKELTREINPSTIQKNSVLYADYNTFYGNKLTNNSDAFSFCHDIENYQRMLGVENVVLRVFHKKYLLNNSVVDDFLSVLGVQDNTAFIPCTPVINAGMPEQMLPMFLGGALPDDMPHKNRMELVRLARAAFSAKNTLDNKDEIAARLEREAADIDRLFAKYHESLQDAAPKHTYLDIYSGRSINPEFNFQDDSGVNRYVVRLLHTMFNDMQRCTSYIAMQSNKPNALQRIPLFVYCLVLRLLGKKNAIIKIRQNPKLFFSRDTHPASKVMLSLLSLLDDPYGP